MTDPVVLQSPLADRLEPCPFCGGEAEVIHLEDGENAGGSCVSCKACLASSNVEFGRKENFISNWNRRAALRQQPVTPDREEVARLIDGAAFCVVQDGLAFWQSDEGQQAQQRQGLALETADQILSLLSGVQK